MAAGDITKVLMANVRVRVGEASKTGILDAQVLAYLNAAQDDILIRVDNGPLGSVSETATGDLTTAAEPCHTGAVSIALPADFVREIIVLYDDIQAKCIDISKLDQVDDNYHRAPTTTNPYYYIWNELLYVEAGVTTTTAHSLYHINRPAVLSLTVDPTISDEFFGMMEDFAVALCREQTGDYEEKRRIRQQYKDRCTILNSRWGAPVYEGQPGDSARSV